MKISTFYKFIMHENDDRIMVRIPGALKELAEKNDINYSEVCRKAICDKIDQKAKRRKK